MGSYSHALLAHKANELHVHLKTSKCGQSLFKNAATESKQKIFIFIDVKNFLLYFYNPT